MMNELLTLVMVFVAGVLLGGVFFGGLWLTVRKGVVSNRPALWFIGSMLVRMSITLIGFYFVAGGQWWRFLICLFGFVISRIIVTLLTRSTKKLPLRAKEAEYAPQS